MQFTVYSFLVFGKQKHFLSQPHIQQAEREQNKQKAKKFESA